MELGTWFNPVGGSTTASTGSVGSRQGSWDTGFNWDTYLEEYYNRARQDAMLDRDWMADREDTQYQRAMADLKAAGINPIAAVTNGMNGSSGVQSNITNASSIAGELSGALTNAINNSKTKDSEDAYIWSKTIKNIMNTIFGFGTGFSG